LIKKPFKRSLKGRRLETNERVASGRWILLQQEGESFGESRRKIARKEKKERFWEMEKRKAGSY